MRLKEWLRPPRHVLMIFLVVAILSAAALSWLAWLLLEQDKVTARQRRLDQAADGATAVMHSALSELEIQLSSSSPIASIPSGLMLLVVEGQTINVRPPGSLLYYPEVPLSAEIPAALFTDAEQAEFIRHDLGGAARLYASIAADRSDGIRAAALTKLAGIHRKTGNASAALEVYDRLIQTSGAFSGLPTGLIARTGRARVFEETHRASELRREASALRDDLLEGRWMLTKWQYASYLEDARKWLAEAEQQSPAEIDAMTRADAVAWLWEHRDVGRETRLLVGRDSALIIRNGTSDKSFNAVIAGPMYLASLCRDAVPDPALRCTLTSAEGRIVVGDQPPARSVAMRPAAASRLPWSLHVFPASENVASPASPQRPLLISVFAVLIVVWSSGAYFIVRAISREMRVARLQSDFVAAVSHEFRSPLSAMRQISEMLADNRVPSEESRRKSYAALARESERLHRLVEDLLDFGKFDAGAAVYHFERVEIGSFLQPLVSEFQQRISSSGFQVELVLPESSVYVRADAQALSLAVLNLLDNAVKYSPECRTVWIEAAVNRGRLSICVRDRGLGIPIHEQRDIFDKFVRGAESKARRIKGTGVGLAMVRHIMEAHRGEIHVSSKPGEGSRFTMLLDTMGGAS
jgi:nitrogen-specific signal transduction histidine kinase